MSIWMWIKLLFTLPSIIPIIKDVISFIKNFKQNGFDGIGELAERILKLIMGMIPVDKKKAVSEADNLKHELQNLDRARKAGALKTSSGSKELSRILARL